MTVRDAETAGENMLYAGEKNCSVTSSRFRECASVLSCALIAVFREHQALDHFLNRLFRSNSKYGSKDRRRIGDALFRVFRDYGFLQILLREEDRSAENLLLYSSVLAGEKEYPACLLEKSPLPEEKLLEIAGKKDFSERISSFGQELSLTDNLPQWLLPCFPSRSAAEDVAESLLTRSPLWFRLNFPGDGRKRKKILDEFASKDIPLFFHEIKKDAFCIGNDKRVQLQEFMTFREGLFEIQDLSSQCIGSGCMYSEMEKEKEDFIRILDCCAGGGGKTLQMASLLHEKGRNGKVFAWDIRKNKLEETFRRGKKAGLKNIVLLDSFPAGKTFDKVLVDAPCSGSGRWRRAPEQRLLLTEEELDQVVATQWEILENAAKCVKENGILIYGTCSVFYKENMGIIEKFLACHPEFSPEGFASPLTGEMCPGNLYILPSNGNCDGSFVARMRKKI